MVSAHSQPRRSLQRKLLLPLMLLGSSVAAMAIWDMHYRFQEHLQRALHQRAELIANTVHYCAESISRAGELQRIVSAIGADQDVADIVVVADDPPRVIASTRTLWLDLPASELPADSGAKDLRATLATHKARHDVDLTTHHFFYSSPLQLSHALASHSGRNRGAVMVRLDPATMEEAALRTGLEASAALAFGMVVVAAAGFALLHSLVLRRISAIDRAITLGRAATDDAWGEASSNDELGALASTLRDALQRTDAALLELENQKFAMDQHAVVAVTDLNGVITYANDRFCAISGYSREELVGQTHRVIGSGTHPREFFLELWETIRAGRVWRGEICNRAKSGVFYWEHATVVPLTGADGNPRAFIAISTDITASKHVEATLRVSEQRQKLAVSAARLGLWDWDLKSGRTVFDHRWCEIIGYHPSELEHNVDTWRTLMNPEDEPVVRARLDPHLAGETPSYQAEFRLRHRDGHWVWIDARGQVVERAEDGSPLRMAGTHIDISRRKEADAQLEQLNRELLSASRRAGMAEVATSVLHNVGNVLNSVNVSATIVANKLRRSECASLRRVTTLLRSREQDLAGFLSHDPKGRQVLPFLEKLADHLTSEQHAAVEELEGLHKNVEHIKEIVALQQNYAKVSGVTEKVKLTELLEETLRLHRETLSKHGMVIVREYDDVPEVTIDKHKLVQILVNLVTNAQQACSAANVPEKRITLRLGQNFDRVSISVSDNGVGIPASNLRRIFNHGFTTKPDGHGFGLHSGALAAREMGGALLVHSDGAGRGATFTIELPLQQPNPATS